ncbi:MAG: glutamine--tRNA ligase/YqeY domain fusion protein [Kiritimatiellae bacterium]|nr:glutamine--tRNA ligase/YqeY domain fusion protein [Kiritimatiellia bacterium]MDD5521348.1 glutamine--tRNA ligase/YqeY domain fusion protein [Kiritimatiellia bacterium]
MTELKEEKEEEAITDFIREIVAKDVRADKHNGVVVTRFPPEPNGYLHIGHAKSICLNFGIAAENKGKCHLRYDDTNPSTEEVEYVDSIRNDVKWLGWDWGMHEYYASDYFEQMYQYAVQLIGKGKAYVCTLSPEEFKEYRGIPTKPGKESPWRDRPVEQNLDLFERMRKGEFKDGEYVLRAKIDMASPNIHMRDPAIYRIKHASHHRTADKWCIYPMYDFAHCLEDSIEGITHSICTLEFEVHRPLYDWILEQLDVKCHPQQIEFARLNLTFTVMSKRKLLELVQGGHVRGWDDPRLPTISGLRRRGYTPESIREFCRRVGVTKFNSYTEIELLEYCVREDLNRHAFRVMSVLSPLKVVIENYPAGKVEMLDAINNPEDSSMGTRKIPFSKELYIERDDFMENPPKKFYRLTPGNEVRLRYAYFIKCEKVVRDKRTGEVVEVRCTYDPATLGGQAPDGRKVKGTIHWVSVNNCVDVEVRLYDRLLTKERLDDVDEGTDFKDFLNPNSLQIIRCKGEPCLLGAMPGSHYQFERKGYFFVDPVDSKRGAPVFNQTVSLRDAWAKIQKKDNG